MRGLWTAGANSLAAALDSLPSLTSLELNAYNLPWRSHVTQSLHHLCSTQLSHLTVSHSRLHYLIHHAAGTVMTHLRSLTITAPEFDSASQYSEDNDGSGSFFEQFPSLLHLAVRCELPASDWDDMLVYGVRLHSFTVHDSVRIEDLSRNTIRTLCLRRDGSDETADRWWTTRCARASSSYATTIHHRFLCGWLHRRGPRPPSWH